METFNQKVDAIFAAYDKTNTPGCSLAVIKDGEIIYERGYGMANLEYGIPNTPSTKFYIASTSKQFTAMAVSLLIKEGKVKLDDDVHQYIGELKDYDTPVTIRHLFHHTSGIRDEYLLLNFGGWRDEDATTTADFLHILSLQKELNFLPGSEWVYSNSNYTLLAEIVARVSGKSMSEFCEERLFKPLGMKNTLFHEDFTKLVPGRAFSYDAAGPNIYSNNIITYGTAGDTGLFTTVEDLALWDQEFYKGKVAGEDVITMMHTEGKLSNGKPTGYAFGLMLNDYRGLKVVEHGGSDGGYRSTLVRFPDQHFSIAILGNFGMLQPNDLARKVADIFLAESFTDKTEIKEEMVIELPREQLEEKAGLYYDAGRKLSMRIEYRDGMLLAGLGPGLPLEAIAPDQMRVAFLPSVKVKFEKTENTMKLKAFLGFKEPDVYEKVEESNPTPAQLNEYTGKYTCPEVENTWEIILNEGQLCMLRAKHPTFPLRSTIKDGFTDTFAGHDLQFERDKTGKISGYRLSTARVRNLMFEKIV